MNKRISFKAFFQERLKDINHQLTDRQVAQLFVTLQALPPAQRDITNVRKTISSVTGLAPEQVAVAFRDWTPAHTAALFLRIDSLIAYAEKAQKQQDEETESIELDDPEVLAEEDESDQDEEYWNRRVAEEIAPEPEADGYSDNSDIDDIIDRI